MSREMKVTSANGVVGCLLNPYHTDGKWMFRVYEGENFTDYELRHSDLSVTITDADASFYDHGDGTHRLDHNSATLGIQENEDV